MAWSGSDFASERSFVFRLQPADVEELDRASAQVAQAGLAFPDISKEAFPLPGLAPRLAAMRRDLRSGWGFALIKGIAAGDHSETDLR
ncbi:MAG: hypothetical protein JWP52_25, partial [Rhizobacter sp.]|nr:hypothetical protein [Rhizobacter sp.]